MDGDAYVVRGDEYGDYSDSLTVTYSVTGGTATNGVDYTLQTGTVVLPEGVQSVEIDFQIHADDETEGGDELLETIVVTVTSAVSSTGKSYVLKTHESAIWDGGSTVVPPAPKNSGCETCQTGSAPNVMNASPSSDFLGPIDLTFGDVSQRNRKSNLKPHSHGTCGLMCSLCSWSGSPS